MPATSDADQLSEKIDSLRWFALLAYRSWLSQDRMLTVDDMEDELVVEVASPRTRLYDMNRKKDVYQSFGIPAYWIVDPDAQRPVLTVFELARGEYAEIARVTGDEPFTARLPFAVTIVPQDLVRLT